MFSTKKLFFLSVILLATSLTFTEASHAQQSRYRRSDISDARFGTGEREAFLKKAHGFAADVNKTIKGQETATKILQERLVQYFENFGSRTGEPIALNLVGLPGIGKTAMLTRLRQLGFNVVHIDAQKYISPDSKFAIDVINGLSPYIFRGSPVILVVEEIDKVNELTKDGRELTSPLIGTLNQILSDGIISRAYASPVEVSNVLVLTTMNFAPEEMTTFTGEVLGGDRSFYDLTVEDFEKFDDWVRKSPSARYKILSRLFRSNTVGRLAPNTVVMQPLLQRAYREIVEITVEQAIGRTTQGSNLDKRIEVEVDSSYIDFLTRETLYAPSGARETVFRSDALTEQLITFGTKSVDPMGDTIDRPRKIKISFDDLQSIARVVVTPQGLSIHGQLYDRNPYYFEAKYSSVSRLFSEPDRISVDKPTYPSQKLREERITKKMIRAARFPIQSNLANGLDTKINTALVGQQETAKTVQDDINRYLGRSGPAKKEPSFRVLAGFPGIGKSELVKIVGKHLGLPIIRVNMQQFSSDDSSSVASFYDTVARAIQDNQENIKNGKFIFLLEELDKIFEIDPQGELKNRPIMGAIKDLLNDGLASVVIDTGNNDKTKTINIRSAFTFVTMNFSVDRFGFTADPRLTTVEDVLEDWKNLNSTPMSIKSMLGQMFLPETVSRLMSRFTIVKPPNRSEYRTLVKQQLNNVIQQRLIDQKGRNIAQVQVDISKRYEDYLFSETVVPSEGARNTVVAATSLIGSDLEDALFSIPKNSKYATAPLIISLDFLPGRSKVIAKVRTKNEDKKMSTLVLDKPVKLNFPALELRGKVSEQRMLTSAHEFGHAFMTARLGLRFEYVVVASPTPNIGGYVKMSGDRHSAIEIMGSVYGALASRALERMIFSSNPADPSSVLRITAGARQDIKMATLSLFNMLYEFGFDPFGGTIDRNFTSSGTKYADYASIPPQLAEKLGSILRDMENQIVEDMLETQSQDWYVEKIVQLARKGVMTEQIFYELIGYTYPGKAKENLQSTGKMRELFGKFLKNSDSAILSSQKQQRGIESMTVNENVERYLAKFTQIVKTHLHTDSHIEETDYKKPKRPTPSCKNTF